MDLKDVYMTKTFIKFHDVDYCYDSAAQSLFKHLTLHIAVGWTGVVGSNGAGKTTLLKLATGLLAGSNGYIERPGRVVYCAQRTDYPPTHYDEFIYCCNRSAQILKSQLKLKEDWGKRWQTLSHGERKRAQIATALWQDPDVLAVDEPTNHLDGQARDMLAAALHSFDKVGLLVSHDRALLDSLCGQCLFIDPPDVSLRKGGYTKGKRIAAVEQETLKKQHDIKKQAFKKLKREAGKRRERANKAAKMRSRKGIAKKDHDAKAKIGAVIYTGKDGVGGKLLNQLEGRLNRARSELDGIKPKKEHTLGIWLPGARSSRDTLLEQIEGEICLGDGKKLSHPRLVIQPEDRIGITGINGSGKSTLIQTLLPRLNVPSRQMVYVPQEIDQTGSKEILARAKALSNEQKGHLMTIVSRLDSMPQRLLESKIPSPGETRKLLLALGMVAKPHIIIMDEPTNHMDITSIECLEEALSVCPCALVLISHDIRFLNRLTHQRWHIESRKGGSFSMQIMG